MNEGGGGSGSRAGGSPGAFSPPCDPCPPPGVDGSSICPQRPKTPHGTHPSAEKSPPGPAPRRVGVAAREGTSGLWAGGAGASLERRTVSSGGGSREERGHQVTAEERRRNVGGGGREVESPLPKINSRSPATRCPREGR